MASALSESGSVKSSLNSPPTVAFKPCSPTSRTTQDTTTNQRRW